MICGDGKREGEEKKKAEARESGKHRGRERRNTELCVSRSKRKMPRKSPK
jgi:hypothetical protein